jgi:hypothetical protein
MRRFLLLRTELDRMLTASMLFSCTLVGIRILHTGRLTFLSMIWNLFLAYIPYAISTGLTAWRKGAAERQLTRATLPPGRTASLKGFLMILTFLAWLLFIPNSFYILTDLYHLADNHRNSRVPEWFDLALILSFAWNGLLLGVLSTRQVEKLLVPDDFCNGPVAIPLSGNVAERTGRIYRQVSPLQQLGYHHRSFRFIERYPRHDHSSLSSSLCLGHDLLLFYTTNADLYSDCKRRQSAVINPPNMENVIITLWNRNKIVLKSFWIGILTLLLLIPTLFIQNLVEERQRRQQEAVTEVSSRWAGAQTVTGPVIGIPYMESVAEGSSTGPVKHWAYFLPASLDMSAHIVPEKRYRGIYQVIVYTTELQVHGSYDSLHLAELNIPPGQWLWNEAAVFFDLGDLQGLKEQVTMHVSRFKPRRFDHYRNIRSRSCTRQIFNGSIQKRP